MMDEKIPEALARYWQVRSALNVEPIITFAKQRGLVSNTTDAYSALDGIFQILASHAESPHLEIPFVLARGDIYTMYLTLRRFYQQEFDKFCYDTFELCHHYLPLDGISLTQHVAERGIAYTSTQLTEQFGDDISIKLHDWILSCQHTPLQPCALIWTKKWRYEMFLPTPSEIAHLCNRWVEYVY